MIPKPKKRVNYKKALAKAQSEYLRLKTACKCEFHNSCIQLLIQPPCICTGMPQLCHKISQSKSAITFDERNVFVGCSSSNLWAHFNQPDWDRLWRRLFPKDVSYLEFALKNHKPLEAWAMKIKAQEYREKTKQLSE